MELFPAPNQPVEIKQGQGGDCYLLSSLECLLNSDPASRAQIEAMFKPNPNGNGIVLRLKPHLLTPQKDKLASRADYERPDYGTGVNEWKRYGYEVDSVTGEHVFYISNKRLQEIAKEKGGVTSNSLAVNILERISAYYYVGNWNPSQYLASVVAHNISDRHNTTSTKFVGALLGFKTHDYPGADFKRILKLQELDPTQAVYISMAYGGKDAYGKFHGRHALRLKSWEEVKDKATGETMYRLSLINPWDNTKVETVDLTAAEFSAAVGSRNVRFCVYSADTDVHELKMMLAESKEQGEYVLKHPDLYNKLLQKQKTDGLSLNEISAHIVQHKKSKELARKEPHEVLPPQLDQKLDLAILQNKLLINPHDEALALALREQLEQINKKVDAHFMLQNVVVAAAYNNSQRPGSSGIADEREKINSALVSYFFLGNYADHTLTRTMQLRFYLTKDIFPDSKIMELFTPREFALFTLTNCMNEGSLSILLESGSQNSLKEYLAKIDPGLVDEAFIKELMAKAKVSDALDLNRQLSSLAFINLDFCQKIIDTQLAIIEKEKHALAEKHKIASPPKSELKSIKGELSKNPYDEDLASRLFDKHKELAVKVDVDFMREYVLTPAAHNNSKKIGGNDVSVEQEKINSALVVYHFVGAPAEVLLTRTMRLRFYLKEDLFPRSEIKDLFTARQFNLLVLMNCMTEPGMLPLLVSSEENSLKQYLKDIKLTQIDNGFVGDLMAKAKIKNLADLDRMLADIKSINPALSKIIKEKGSLLLGPNIQEILAPISNFSISFQGLHSIQSIRAKRDELVRQLNELSANLPPNVVVEKESLVKQKLEEINKQANLGEKNLSSDDLKKELQKNPRDLELGQMILANLKDHNKRVDKDFMVALIEMAALSNSEKRALPGLEMERKQIYSALIAFHFLGHSAQYSLTGAMQLRSYLSEGIFPRSEIAKLFTTSEFAIAARNFAISSLGDCIGNQGKVNLLNTNPSLKDYLRTFDLTLVTKDFCNELLAKIEIKSVADLNNKLAGVRAVNPSLANLISAEGLLRIDQSDRKVLEPIRNFPISFKELDSVEDIRVKKDKLAEQLNEIAKALPFNVVEEKDRLVNEKLAEIKKHAELQEKLVLAREKQLAQEQQIKEEKQRLLQAINFTSRLKTIEDMKNRLAGKVEEHPNYKGAADRAQELYDNLFKAHKNFLNDPKETLASFKQYAVEEVKDSMKILNVHRGWKQILESFANAILSLAEGLGLKSKNSTWGFFEVKTDSRKTAEEFIESVNKLGNS